MRIHPTTPRVRTRVQQLALITALVLGLLGFATTGVADASPSAEVPADRDTFSSGHIGGGSAGGWATQIWEPTQTHHRSSVLIFESEKDADKFAKKLNNTLEKAEKKADKGKGDTSDPEEDDAFQVGFRGDGWAVSHGGRTIGVYDSKEEANSVANALNDEVDKRKKKGDCIDPDVFGRELEVLSAA